MAEDEILKGRKILVVDDEEDILDTLVEILDECRVSTASSFEGGKERLEKESYDAVILDIMGVQGFDLLEIAMERKVPALMLTAHGLNPDNLVGSIKIGAKSYIPKDKMNDMGLYLKEVFIAGEKGIDRPGAWLGRLGSFFDDRFGHGWKNKDKKFWSEFDKTYEVSKEELQGLL